MEKDRELVNWAKEDRGRIAARKTKLEKIGRDREHRQVELNDRPRRRLISMMGIRQKITITFHLKKA